MNKNGPPRPVVVVGAPRSGTSMLGALLGSVPGVADLGEYGGFELAYRIAERETLPLPSTVSAAYVQELQRHAHEFPQRLASGRTHYIASSPWNLLVLRRILEAEPRTIAVICLRRVEGVCQSLERSYRSKRHPWAGPADSDRVDIWCQCYSELTNLTNLPVIFFNYDRFCADPKTEIQRLAEALLRLDFPFWNARVDLLATSHANAASPRPVVARFGEGGLEFSPISSWDEAAWSDQHRDMLTNHTGFGPVWDKISHHWEE
jgi:hypothetical protein